jgi:hypothetical protein
MNAETDTTPNQDHPSVFRVKDCALVALATGRKARSLQEFREILRTVEAGSIYHHFWGGLLQPRFEEREFNNDFASWVRHGIHDAVLAERLAALHPARFTDLDELRTEIVDLIDDRIDEADHLLWTRPTEQFEFIRSQVVVFDTEDRLQHPRELAGHVPRLTTSSVFYHFIDARRRTPDHLDDFSDWLGAWGDEFRPVMECLAGVDPYFGSLAELRSELATVLAAGQQGED